MACGTEIGSKFTDDNLGYGATFIRDLVSIVNDAVIKNTINAGKFLI